jgi:hypothetical protein
VVINVAGELGPLLGLLAEHSVHHMSFPEPSLEEAFTAFYEKPTGAGTEAGQEDKGDRRSGR